MVDATELKSLAHEAKEQSEALMAIALAIEDGKLSKDQAKKAIELHHSDNPLALVQSEVYPGDEYFDRATGKLNGYA